MSSGDHTDKSINIVEPNEVESLSDSQMLDSTPSRGRVLSRVMSPKRSKSANSRRSLSTTTANKSVIKRLMKRYNISTRNSDAEIRAESEGPRRSPRIEGQPGSDYPVWVNNSVSSSELKLQVKVRKSKAIIDFRENGK